MTDIHHDQSGELGAVQSVSVELTPEEKKQIYFKATNHARLRLSLYVHVLVFVVVMPFLLIINLATSVATLWVVWPFCGWGVGLLIHWFAIIKLAPIYESIKVKEIVRQLEIRQ